MPLDWSDVPVFLAAARTGSLKKAAEQLDIAQPTMTRRIAAIEAALGTVLFERSPAGLSLSVAGQLLLHDAELAEAAMKRFEVNARHVSAAGDRPVRIAVHDPNWMMTGLLDLRAQNPDILLDVRSKFETGDLFRREIDIAIRREKPTEVGLVSQKVATLSYALTCSESYIAREGMPTLKTLGNFSLVEYAGYFREGETSAWRRVLDSHPRVVLRTDHLGVLIQAMVRGVGMAMAMVGAAEEYPTLVTVVPELAVPSKDIFLCFHEDVADRPIIRRTVDCLVAYFKLGWRGRLRGLSGEYAHDWPEAGARPRVADNFAARK